MQIKEVKIAGFQTENVKITLTYQASESWQRYIIRRNRKIIISFNKEDENKAKIAFISRINGEMYQTKLNI